MSHVAVKILSTIFIVKDTFILQIIICIDYALLIDDMYRTNSITNNVIIGKKT